MRPGILAIAALIALAIWFAPAMAWNFAVHEMVTRIAIGALPPGPLKSAFLAHMSELEHFSIEPDLLREEGDKNEGRRHYIDLEYYGNDPFAALNPNEAATAARFGARTLRKSGTLPWTIENKADTLAGAWREGDCRSVFKAAGYLSHYVADASQPLHSTIHYDGYPEDRGMHLRLERAADAYVAELELEVRPRIRLEKLDNVWPPVMAELRESNALVAQTIAADRVARLKARSARQFNRLLIAEEHSWIVKQLATAASILASVWQLEWDRGGRRSICGSD
jgi:hypothetical protein